MSIRLVCVWQQCQLWRLFWFCRRLRAKRRKAAMLRCAAWPWRIRFGHKTAAGSLRRNGGQETFSQRLSVFLFAGLTPGFGGVDCGYKCALIASIDWSHVGRPPQPQAVIQLNLAEDRFPEDVDVLTPSYLCVQALRPPYQSWFPGAM